MHSTEKLYRKLVEQYGAPLPFKKICADEKIIHEKDDLGDGIHGMYCKVNSISIIVLNSTISYNERRDWGWHELWHHFNAFHATLHYADKEEKNATRFAALCRVPSVHWGETVDALVERCGVSPWIAKARIEHEIKKLNT